MSKLRYVHLDELTICRRRSGSSFRYYYLSGEPLKDNSHLARIRKMALPPAWEEVRICARAQGHLQAIGKDVKGRWQYRYHEDWTKHRNETKFHRMLDFAKVLPKIRRTIRKHMNQRGVTREKVLAAAVDLLQKTNIRVGNEIYSKTNHSYGLTTLRNRHAQISGARIHLRFRAKSGKTRDITFEDLKLSRILKRLQELPGQELFEYVGADGKVHRVTSSEVNRYIEQISGQHFTAKDFRTWCGTIHALQSIQNLGKAELKSERDWRRRHLTVIRKTAEFLGNTPSICEKYYIHPGIFKADRNLSIFCKSRIAKPGLTAFECSALSLFRQH